MNLRDRIICALLPLRCHLEEPCEECRIWVAQDADAVIVELGTDCIYRYVCAHCGEFWFDQSERMQRFALLHNKGHLNE